MPIQHQRLIPRYTRWRLLEDGVLAEERLWNNTVGSGTVSFSGVVEAFFFLWKPELMAFPPCSRLPPSTTAGPPACAPPLEAGLSPHHPTLMSSRGDIQPPRRRAEPLLPCPQTGWRDPSHPRQASCLPPLCTRERALVYLCSSSSHAVGAGPFITPGQLFWWNRGKQCSSGNGNDLSIVASRGIWMLAAGRSKERLKRT